MAGVEIGSAHSVIEPPSLSGPPSGTSAPRPISNSSPASRGHEQGDDQALPPASQATAMDLALGCWSVRSQRHAAMTSSMAAGKGCSGANRYSGTAPASRWPVRRAASSPSLPEANQARSLRRAGRGAPGRASAPGAASQWAGTPPARRSPERRRAPEKAARGGERGAASASVSGAWLAFAFCRSLKTSIKSLHCLAWHVGISSWSAAGPRAADRLSPAGPRALRA